MWILTPEGMYSVVKPSNHDNLFLGTGRPGDLAVRARSEQDLNNLRENWLPELSDTVVSPNRDYGFRGFANPDAVARALSRIVLALDYGNFKDQVKAVQGPERAAIYGKVWGNLLDIQYGPWDATDEDYEPYPADDIADAYPHLFEDGDMGVLPKEAAPRRGRFSAFVASAKVAFQEARYEYEFRRTAA